MEEDPDAMKHPKVSLVTKVWTKSNPFLSVNSKAMRVSLISLLFRSANVFL